jgi:hypothetical protein
LEQRGGGCSGRHAPCANNVYLLLGWLGWLGWLGRCSPRSLPISTTQWSCSRSRHSLLFSLIVFLVDVGVRTSLLIASYWLCAWKTAVLMYNKHTNLPNRLSLVASRCANAATSTYNASSPPLIFLITIIVMTMAAMALAKCAYH